MVHASPPLPLAAFCMHVLGLISTSSPAWHALVVGCCMFDTLLLLEAGQKELSLSLYVMSHNVCVTSTVSTLCSERAFLG